MFPPELEQIDVYLQVFDATKKSMYMDQTGRFPVVPSTGNKYLMVTITHENMRGSQFS